MENPDDSNNGRKTKARRHIKPWLDSAQTNVQELFGLAKQTMAQRIWVNFSQFLSERQLLVWSLAAVIGISVAYASIIFRWLIGVIQWPWLYTTGEKVASAAAAVPWWNIMLAPTLGGLLVGYILQRYTSGGRAHGVADVIE
ncbi:MAG: hypothetical protein AAFO75_14475, partial [Pseudomonadota bacterium]